MRNLGPATVIKLTPEDIVSLQQQQHGGSLDHYQQHQQSQQPVTQLAATGQEGTKSIEISLPSGTAHMLALPAGVVEGKVMAPAGSGGKSAPFPFLFFPCIKCVDMESYGTLYNGNII